MCRDRDRLIKILRVIRILGYLGSKKLCGADRGLLLEWIKTMGGIGYDVTTADNLLAGRVGSDGT